MCANKRCGNCLTIKIYLQIIYYLLQPFGILFSLVYELSMNSNFFDQFILRNTEKTYIIVLRPTSCENFVLLKKINLGYPTTKIQNNFCRTLLPLNVKVSRL